jgi:epoxyqueuosine reductase
MNVGDKHLKITNKSLLRTFTHQYLSFRLMETSKLTLIIKQLAKQIGFTSCGIARAERLESEGLQLKDWLQSGRQAGMNYMEKNFELRVDPDILWPGAKSMIVVAINYYPGNVEWGNPDFKISRYALGTDYHDVLREKLYSLLGQIQEIEPTADGRVCVDSAPVMEKIWAQKAGIGWQGKNSLLLTKNHGSYVFLGILIVNLELVYDSPETDHCVTCHKCMVACPTHAIVSPGVVDSRNCISYHTIERKDNFDNSTTPVWDKWIFGCDICQEVCPYNHGAEQTGETDFLPRKEILELSGNEWIQLDVERYLKIFRKSPVKRAKLKGLKRNIEWVTKNKT